MDKILKLFLALIVFGICYIPSNAQYTIKTVVIDAGHGGKDPGAIGIHAKEKDITLSIALKLGKYIEERIEGVKIIYTRKTDVFIPLHTRAEIANKNKADLFISIHVNANTNTYATGTDSWVMGYDKSEKNLEVAKLENQVILVEENYDSKYQGLDPNSTEAYIIFELMQNIYLEQSLNFANIVQNQFKTRVGRKSRGVKQAPFFVLWNTTMPSVLVETGFITNSAEEAFLISDEGQDYMASAIFRAFREYKKEIDKRSNAPKKLDTQEDSVYFSIQILSSSNKIELLPENFKGYNNVSEYQFDGMFKYTIGKNTNYTMVEELKDKIKNDFHEAFIIAIKNGVKISLKEALDSTE